MNSRYILFIHLVINDMIQMFLSSLLHVVSYVFLRVSAPSRRHGNPHHHQPQQRYAAVCLPLRHARLCSPRRTYALIGLTWAASLLAILPHLAFLPPPRLFLRSRVLCVRAPVFGSGRSAAERDVWHPLVLAAAWLLLLFTYANANALQLLLSVANYVRPPLERRLLAAAPPCSSAPDGARAAALRQPPRVRAEGPHLQEVREEAPAV